ncbi:MAG: 3-hydroxyacyl-CoA dehydrogenase [Janthinobacterium lividum]
MISADFEINCVGIVGAGAMGRGIAQIAAQAGLQVRLFDLAAAAVKAAQDNLAETLGKLAAKGKLTDAQVQETLARISGCGTLQELAGCDLVIEAVVEKLEVKRDLFKQLEAVVGDACILVSNTSSLSITAIAAVCAQPGRIAGYHFFNPVPLMKVVEVIDGARTDATTGEALTRLARRMGHTPVRAKDMPGFIVNHAGRGMNTEGLRVAQEGVADFADIDRVMREQAGFRLGPFELMDLTALDVSHPVMESIYHQFYEEARFRPSPITAQRLAGGLLGRKTGEGFYVYRDGKQQVPPEAEISGTLPSSVWISPEIAGAHDELVALAKAAGVTIESGAAPSATALILVTPLGFDATHAAVTQGLEPTRTVAVDTLFPLAGARRRTVMTTPATLAAHRDAARALLAHDGVAVTAIRDSGGFIAQRIVASIVNIASEIAQQRIASPQDIDLAVTLGLGYPQGPLALGDSLGASRILTVLTNLTTLYSDPRYRPSLWLARRAALGLSLLTEEN